MSKVYAVVNTKGGAGKTAVSAQVLPAILENTKVMEIDDNNQSSRVFANSKIIKEFKTVKVDASKEVLRSVAFELMGEGDSNIIIDAGGGNDSKRVIENILKMDIETTFIIPIMPDIDFVQNGIETAKMLSGQKIIFCLNNSTQQDLHSEFRFFFGWKNIANVWEQLGSLPYFPVKQSYLFSYAKISNKTIADLAELAYQFDYKTAKKVFYDQAAGDERKFAELMESYEISTEAKEYIDALKIYKDILQ